VFVVCLGLLVGSLFTAAVAQTEFEASPFDLSEFRDFQKIESHCTAPAAASFFCRDLDAVLTKIPTKGVDFFFDQAGHLVAAFAKHQKGQNLRSYTVDNGQDLIPFEAAIPGGSVLVDGEFFAPEDLEGEWERTGRTSFLGTFRYRVADLQVDKTVLVSNVSHTLEVSLEVTRVGQAGTSEDAGETGISEADAVTVQYSFPGIGRAQNPIIKIGQGATFSQDPLPQPVADPAYISLQSNQTRGIAIIMRPGGSRFEGLEAQSLQSNRIAVQKPLAADAGSSVSFALGVYTGPNELVRYDQEGYAELPGLFTPNILGRLSLAIIWVLEWIHGFVGNWGLSIIVLTLLFRAVVWPLISTQTKSMYGMQQLQPKIQALQKKHKDDREKLTQETMKLYREAGVNPAGGCLPVILQMPLFIILWRVFVNFEFNEGFLWLPDLGQADPIYILPALYVAVMLGQSYFAARGNPQSLRQQVIINLVFVFIIINFPAGVILYFVVSMLIQVLQYWLISRSQPSTATAK
jgi:YidC/Oxa1 family membrane protein insertase